MSTPDERHYLRLFENNPPMQEAFLVRLLSMRSFHERNEEESPTVQAIDVVIGAFTEKYTDWEDESSVVFGEIQAIRANRK